ncbi:hypothetical protein CY35_08G008300 [Sphagnum magellanicum]|nr:hypothetical protein CY35_08G008300 [Sphagnum magellanicum]
MHDLHAGADFSTPGSVSNQNHEPEILEGQERNPDQTEGNIGALRLLSGVADGVGGWAELGVDVGKYARELMSQSLLAVRQEPHGYIDPARIMRYAHSKTKCPGSSTACILALSDNIMASTNDHITNLLSISHISRGTKGPVLTVQCPSEYQNRGLQVYAAKPVNIDGSYISVHSEPAHVAVVDVSESSIDPSTSVLMVLTMAIPVAQISWSMLFPSRGSTAVAVVGQVLGWILGWLTLQLLATRYLVLGHLRELPGINVMQAELVAQITWRCQEKTEMVGSWKAKIYDMHNVQVGGAQYAKLWSNGCDC